MLPIVLAGLIHCSKQLNTICVGMLSVKRVKRDTAENIYKQCQITGTCPPDVVNKIEGKTWADILLQIFSSVIYLGNLGIGTGKGSPTLGTRVVGGGVRVPETIAPPTVNVGPNVPRGPVGRPSRPFSVPIDTIGAGVRPVGPRVVDPSGLRPVDVIDPSSPSIVTLSEALPDNVVTTAEGTLPDFNVITDTTSIISHPTVLQTPELELAILNVTPADPPPTKVLFSSEVQNPLFTYETTVGHINPDYDIIVNPFATMETISYGEDIPLQPLTPTQDFAYDSVAKTSTPETALERSVSRFRELYNRRTEQVPTRNVNLYGDVSRAIQFGFENPAFDPEISLQFEEDVSQVLAAPDIDFAGVKTISRPIYDSTPKGTIRVGRLATKAGVRTRSGTVATQKVHYFYDMSTIQEIELPVLAGSQMSTQTPIVQETVIDATIAPVPDSELLDDYTEQFNNAHLVFPISNEEDESLFFPLFKPVPTIATNLYNPLENTFIKPATIINVLPDVPVIPNILYDGISIDYNLHPSLLPRRKRKRSDSF